MLSPINRRFSKTQKLTTMASSQVALVILLLLVLVDNKSHQAVLPNQLTSSNQPSPLDQSQISSSSSSSPSSSPSSSLATVGPNGNLKPEQSPSASVVSSAGEMNTQMSNSIGSINQPTQHQAPPVPPMGMPQQVSPLPSSMVLAPQPTIWPKVNIFASSAEVKKLLGLPTQINYIENGVPNTYALGFQIPMGYALSDMIFTWQNLGPTNVNYSISLQIGNVEAVLRPSINITRNGLIPRHEQVFKITLPCSGKIIDEVDVEVLINITGLVPVTQQLGEGDANYAANSDETLSEFQLARAIQQQNDMLAAAAAAAAAQLNAAQPMDQMQADQSGGGDSSGATKRPIGQMRLVSHKLAIKRKKICTIDRVPVEPNRKLDVRPPNQKPGREIEQPAPKVSGFVIQSEQQQQQQPVQQQQTSAVQQTSAKGHHQPAASTPLATPEHSPMWTETPIGPIGGQTLTPQPPPGRFSTGQPQQQQPQPPQVTSTQTIGPNRSPAFESSINWPTTPQAPKSAANEPANSLAFDPLRQQPNTASANSPLLFSLIVMSLVVSAALIALLVLGSNSSSSTRTSYGRGPFDKLSALTNCIWRRTSAGSRAVNKCTKNVGPITIKNGLIGTFGTSMTNGRGSTTTGHNHHHHHHHNHHGGGPHGLKSNVSSISGLSTISNLESKHHHLNSLMAPYCQSKQLQGGHNAGYYHHYQQPPDLLIGAIGNSNNNNSTAPNSASNNGFHYSPITSPYQITMSNNQMTKLFLANPTNSGTYSIDNNYMPIATTTTSSSNGSGNGFQVAPQSDSGSVYQTIY